MLHVPVLLNDVLEFASEIPFDSGVFLDGTFGRGGHSLELKKANPSLNLLALDCDEEAVEYGKKELGIEVHHSNFTDFEEVLGDKKLAGALLDLGVSSPQLDEGERGFSFYHDGPLDMRMDRTKDFDASELVNTWNDMDLIELFKEYGEVRRPDRLVQALIERRREKKFETAQDLAGFIESVEGWRKKGHHPATNYFMAIRIAVNQELSRVEEVLPKLAKRLEPNGRLLVITFHSLEDRIVKNIFKQLKEESVGFPVNKKVIQATWDEKKKNPRARSAKLRVFQRDDSKGQQHEEKKKREF